MKISLVTNIPAPYRIKIYEILYKKYGDNFIVIFCAKSEPNRKWTLHEFNFNYIFLKENIIIKKDGYNYVHNNPDVFKVLHSFNPDVVITTGFNPTFLYAWLYCKIFRKKHVCMTDGWLVSEKNLTIIHKLVRKIVYKTSHAFIGASKNSLKLYKAYGIDDKMLFQSHLCVDNERFKNDKKFEERKYHLMFSGQFIDIKMPLFFADVAYEVSKFIKNLKILILGDGPLKTEFFNKLNNYKLDFYYAGFVDQDDLPKFYSDAKLFYFPTKTDAWGIVVNEAMASGTPVVTTKNAGVINDLVLHEINGFVLDEDVSLWAKISINVLQDTQLWNNLSKNAVKRVNEFNYEAAANGIIKACEYALNR